MPKRVLPWRPDSVVDFIKECLDAGGLPMFRTSYAGARLSHGGEPAVLAVCYMAADRVPSTLFYGVPVEDLVEMERETGDWKIILAKYGTDEDVRTYLGRYGEVLRRAGHDLSRSTI